MALNLNRAYRLNPAVSLRPEPFGALAYHVGLIATRAAP